MKTTFILLTLMLTAGSLTAQDSLQKTSFTRSLSAITVTAAKPLIERKHDRIVVNVERMIAASSGNVLELLGKLPGVSVDQEGTIRYNNKSGVLVLIDNRLTYLSGDALANLLQNMSGNEVESVEIIPNPPARYDAAGNAGILNIKTKKGLKKGMNGSLIAGYSQGMLPRENVALNLNYRNNKWNLFGSLAVQDQRNKSQQFINRTLPNNSGTEKNVVHSQDAIRNHSRSGGLKLGVDHAINKKSTLGILINTNLLDAKVSSATNSNLLSGDSLTNRLQTNTAFDFNRKNASGNLNYKQAFQKSGQELSADVDYMYYRSSSNQQIHTYFYNASGSENSTPLQLQSASPVHIHIWSGKVDYTHPLGENTRIETGIKSNYVSNNNQLQYQRLQDGQWIADARSNDFTYKERIAAAYFNYTTTWEKLSLQAGLRVEQTHGTGMQQKGVLRFTRDTLNFFPTLFLGYQLSDKHSLSINYGKRIERPQYEALNPFIVMLDTLTAEQGNPSLRPQYVNNVGLNYTYNRSLLFSLEYNATNDVISKIVHQTPGEKISIFMLENISRVRTTTASVSYNAMLTRWWQAGYYAALIYTHYKGMVDNSPVSFYNTAFNVNINNSFQWQQGWSAEVSAIYNGRYLNDFLGIAQPVFSLNVGIAKSWWNNKAKIQLAMNDLTWAAESMRTNYGNLRMYNWYRADKRRIGLTFTWKFGKATVEKERNRTTGTKDEERRLKS